MTGPELDAALRELGWSRMGVADRLGVSERSVRRWLAGQIEVPERVGAWLEAALEAHRRLPAPPRRPERARGLRAASSATER